MSFLALVREKLRDSRAFILSQVCGPSRGWGSGGLVIAQFQAMYHIYLVTSAASCNYSEYHPRVTPFEAQAFNKRSPSGLTRRLQGGAGVFCAERRNPAPSKQMKLKRSLLQTEAKGSFTLWALIWGLLHLRLSHTGKGRLSQQSRKQLPEVTPSKGPDVRM